MVEVVTASVVVLAPSPSPGRLLHVFLRVHLVLDHVPRILRVLAPCRCPSRQPFRWQELNHMMFMIDLT